MGNLTVQHSVEHHLTFSGQAQQPSTNLLRVTALWKKQDQMVEMLLNLPDLQRSFTLRDNQTYIKI